jgi:hypothetical protein
MNKRAIRGLIGLNALLAVCLAVVTFSPAVTAQQPKRAPGDYTMVAGVVQGSPSAVIYIVDATNQELVAIMWDQSRKQMNAVGYRDLAEDGKVTKRGGR